MTQNTDIEQLKRKIEELEKQISGNKDFAIEQKKIEEEPLHKLYEWTAPDRINVRRTPKWYNTIIIVSVLTIAFALLTDNFVLIFVVVAIAFFIYVSTATPPSIQKLAVTNKGMLVDQKLHYWSEIAHFWVSERSGYMLINIELKDYKGRIVLLQGDGDITKIITEMIKHEDYREPTGLFTFISNMTDGKGKKITEFSSQSKQQPNNSNLSR